MKCRPMNFSGRSVTEASLVMEMDEVLEASSVSGRRWSVRERKMIFLIASSSVAASITRSVSPTSAGVTAEVIRGMAPCRASTVIMPRAA